MKTAWPVLLITILFGCGGGDEQPQDADQNASGAAAAPATLDPNDPCNLVAQEEMERFIGPMLEPPYRTDSRRADPTGSGCLYRARDHRNVTLEVDRTDGELGFRMLAGAGGQIQEMLAGADASTDTLTAEWDKIGRAFGQLIALKGPASVQIDPLASRLDLAAQVAILRIALARLPTPLAYDGAGPARSRSDVAIAPRDPCSLVTPAEAESLMGRLRAAPHASEDRDACVFPIDANFLGTPVDRSLQVLWTDGFYALGQEREALGMAPKVMGRAMGPDLPSLGENTTGGKEPWDERITLLGGVITVVKKDVMLKIAADGVAGFDESRALALLRIAAARI